jgi:hypothetical protein
MVLYYLVFTRVFSDHYIKSRHRGRVGSEEDEPSYHKSSTTEQIFLGVSTTYTHQFLANIIS